MGMAVLLARIAYSIGALKLLGTFNQYTNTPIILAIFDANTVKIA